MEIVEVIKHALDGSVLLFVGSGFSRSARNVDDRPLKTGRELATWLSNECGVSGPAGLEDVAELYVAKHGVSALIKILLQEFQVSTLAPEHIVFGQVPWRRVYTTNYDDVVEQTYRKNGKTIVPLTIEDNVRRVTEPTSQCVHINGYINTLTEDTLFSSFKLTDTSYSSSAFSNSSWASQFRHDISAASAVLFVGYSAYDLDIKRILLESPELREKTIFIVGQNPDELIQNRLTKFGLVVADDTAGIASKIEAIRSTYEPREYSKVTGRYVVQITPPAAASNPRDRDIQDLFLWGRVKRELVWSTLSGATREPYVCGRDSVMECLQMLEDGETDIVVRSDLGNGKSVFLELLGAAAAQYGYKVFSLDASGPDSLSEIEDVARVNDKTLLLLDGYTNKRDEVETVARLRTEQLSVVYSARTLRHDVSYEWLQNTLGREDLAEFDLDVLSEDEAKWFLQTMNVQGLWRSHAERSDTRKMQILQEDCNGRISNILLYILESPVIVARLKELTDSLSKHSKEFLEATASILSLSVLEIGTTSQILSDLIDNTVLNQAAFRNNEFVRELLDFERRHIGAKSSVVARHILSSALDPNVTVTALANIAQKADVLSASNLYRQILRDLMRFSNIQSVLPSQHRMNAVLVYYERIKNLKFSQRNPNFWLQYGIAELSLQRFKEARIKLETAYSHAKAMPNYDTFMLDNQTARLELEEATAEPKKDRETAIAVFRKARLILNRQVVQKEHRHYPYRVASSYLQFLSTHSGVLGPDGIEEVVRAARFVLRRICALSAYHARHRYVAECQRVMEEILKEYPVASSDTC